MKILFCSDEISFISSKIGIADEIEFIKPEDISEYNLNNFEALAGFGLKGIDLSHFKWIHSLGAGVDWITGNDTLNEETIVTRMNTGFETSIFEYVLTRVLVESNNILTYMSDQSNKNWNPVTSNLLREMKIIILGTGSIGTGLARGFSSFGSSVSGLSRSGNSSKYFTNVYTMDNLPQQVFNDYVVINTLPSTSSTRGILNRDFFRKFRSAIFINVGRGDSVIEDALIEAVSLGNLSSAWLDVFADEPLPCNSKLWNTDNVYITPHIAGPTQAADMVVSFVKTYKALIKNIVPDNQVNINAGY